jgi:hypothetical protein
MLSSISGKYFAGHLVPQLPDSLVRYSLQLDSYPGTGDTVYDLSGNNRNLVSTGISYDPSQPRSIQFPGGFGGITSAPGFSEGISTTHYQTVTFWYYQTSDISAGQSPLCSISNSASELGAYIYSIPTTRLRMITNGLNLDNIQMTASGVVTPGTWQMITFKYILSATLPCVLYINSTQIYSYVHGADSVTAGTNFRITIDMAYGFGKWSDFTLFDQELTLPQISARYTSTKSYFGL